MPSKQTRSGCLDTCIAAALFAAAFVLCMAHLMQVGLSDFYQKSFSPAVTFACTGKLESLAAGWVSAPSPELAAVHDFLLNKRRTLSCSDVPPGSIGREPFHSLQYQTLYLITAVGVIWRLIGISWDAVFIIAGVLTGALVLGVYGVCRLFLPVGWAVIATVMATLSPWQEIMIPQLRDYAKAPFILGVIFFAGLLVKSPTDLRRSALAAALAGFVAGAGFGVRADLASAIPFFLIVLIGLLLWTRFRAWRQIALAGALFALGFLIPSWPILTTYRGGGLTGHVSLLGLTTPFNELLGLNAQIYDVGHLNLDQYISGFIHSYATRFRDTPSLAPPLELLGPDYNRYSLWAFVEYAAHFPADMVIRGYSSALDILGADFSSGKAESRYQLDDIRKLLLWPELGLYLFAAALMLIATIEARMAAFLVLVLGYFGCLGALQLHFRHVFYLEILYWLSAAIVVASVWQLVRTRWRVPPHRRVADFSPGKMVRALAMPGIVLAAAAVLLMAARIYQQSQVTALFDRYGAVETQPVEIYEQQRGDAVLLRPVGMMPNLSGSIVSLEESTFDGFYFVVRIDGDRCPGNVLSAKVSYRSDPPYADFSRTIEMPLPGQSHLFFPVMNCQGECGNSRFEGLAVAPTQRQCIAAVEAVQNFRSLPLPLWLTLQSNWRQLRLYQTRVRDLWPF